MTWVVMTKYGPAPMWMWPPEPENDSPQAQAYWAEAERRAKKCSEK